MALYHADEKNLVKCTCGCTVFTDKDSFMLTKQVTRKGDVYIKDKVGKSAVCTKCGIAIDVSKFAIIDR